MMQFRIQYRNVFQLILEIITSQFSSVALLTGFLQPVHDRPISVIYYCSIVAESMG